MVAVIGGEANSGFGLAPLFQNVSFICLPVRRSVRRTFYVLWVDALKSSAERGGGRKKERAWRLLNRADKIACLCTNANSSERLFTLPVSRSFDSPPHLRRAACLFFSFFVPHCSHAAWPVRRSRLTARPAVLDLADDDEATGGSLRMLCCGCRLPSGSKTKPHYHKELSPLLEDFSFLFLFF